MESVHIICTPYRILSNNQVNADFCNLVKPTDHDFAAISRFYRKHIGVVMHHVQLFHQEGYYRVVDVRKFQLAVLEYGIEYTSIADTTSTK